MPVGDPTKVIGIRLTAATLERLRERAAVERRTVAMMAGLIIEDALQPQSEAPAPPQPESALVEEPIPPSQWRPRKSSRVKP